MTLFKVGDVVRPVSGVLRDNMPSGAFVVAGRCLCQGECESEITLHMLDGSDFPKVVLRSNGTRGSTVAIESDEIYYKIDEFLTAARAAALSTIKPNGRNKSHEQGKSAKRISQSDRRIAKRKS